MSTSPGNVSQKCVMSVDMLVLTWQPSILYSLNLTYSFTYIVDLNGIDFNVVNWNVYSLLVTLTSGVSWLIFTSLTKRVRCSLYNNQGNNQWTDNSDFYFHSFFLFAAKLSQISKGLHSLASNWNELAFFPSTLDQLFFVFRQLEKKGQIFTFFCTRANGRTEIKKKEK